MKNKRILILMFIGFSIQTFAQETQLDSAALKTKIAKADTRYFRPNKQAKAAHRKNHLLRTSNYFKPTATTVKDSKWINDSTYVAAYKTAAYQELSKQHTTGHNVLIAGGIVVGAYAVGTLIFLATIFKLK